MNIPESLVRYYLQAITVGYFDHNDLPPDEVTGYEKEVRNMEFWARDRGDLNYLKSAFEYLIANPDIDSSQFAGMRYPFDDQEVREIIQYALKTIWPDEDSILQGGPNNIKLVQMALEDWWSKRDHSLGR